VTDRWVSYFCNVNDEFASIRVNLALAEVAPDKSLPWLLCVWLAFQNPRSDGLSSPEEAPTLFRIEDALAAALDAQCGTVLAGCITTQGRREFYFYGRDKGKLREAVAKALADFAGYHFDVGEYAQPDWNQFRNVLYPTPEVMETIKNRDLVEVLVSHKDALTVARDVHHWLYFPTENARELFKRDAVEWHGFRVESESKADGELPFGIRISKLQAVDQGSANKTSTELLHLSKK
jgi:hypothetical protein